MKITRNEARSGVALDRAIKLSALGALSALIACGGFSNPTTSAPPLGSGGSSGSTSSAAGTVGVSGTFGTAGTVATSTGGGGDTGTAGTFGIAGTSAGGALNTAPFCSPSATPVQPRAPLPLAVTTVFTPSGYEGGDQGMNGNGQIATGACTDRAPGAIGKCASYTWTPATPPTWAGVAYIRGYQGFGSTGHDPICLADGATAITFYAKGAVGGETVGFAGGTAPSQDFVLTTTWTLYTIPLSGLTYNTDATGLEDGFFWKIAPPATGTAVAETFYVDDIQFVGTPASTGGGGAGGAGGAATGGGAGGAGAGGTGGAPAGSGGA
jgi:hypothetical protein